MKKRTAGSGKSYGSHVMEFGDIGLSKEKLVLYMGTNPANENLTFVDENSSLRPPSRVTNQRDADLVHFWEKVYLILFAYQCDLRIVIFNIASDYLIYQVMFRVVSKGTRRFCKKS